jgi:hypothetical protein
MDHFWLRRIIANKTKCGNKLDLGKDLFYFVLVTGSLPTFEKLVIILLFADSCFLIKCIIFR